MPGPHYQFNTDWSKNLPTKTGQFKKAARNTISAEIFINAKSIEKNPPGPGKYDDDKKWKN